MPTDSVSPVSCLRQAYNVEFVSMRHRIILILFLWHRFLLSLFLSGIVAFMECSVPISTLFVGYLTVGHMVC